MKKILIFNFVFCACSLFANFKDWAKTPPMGWNSWDCYGPTVCEEEVKANADFMARNLKQFGWEYIIVDIRWYIENPKANGYQKNPIYVIDEFGRYLPAENRFPSAKGGKGFKSLADYVHSKGLKFGIHVMRGIPKLAVQNKLPIKNAKGITADKIASDNTLCWWLFDNKTIENVEGAQEYYDSIISLYASWGVDFLKIDDLSKPYHKHEIEMIRKAIDKTGRRIVLSTSPGETPIQEAEHIKNHANMWRIVPDLWDNWNHVKNLLNAASRWIPHNAYGTYPDCDMIPLGRIAIRSEVGSDRQCKLSQDEQRLLIALMAICKSPLMFGGDLPSLDDFTLSILTNKELIKINQKSENVRLLKNEENLKIFSSENKKLKEFYIAFFNSSDSDLENVEIELPYKIAKGAKLSDIFFGETNATLTANKIKIPILKKHSCLLLKAKAESLTN